MSHPKLRLPDSNAATPLHDRGREAERERTTPLAVFPVGAVLGSDAPRRLVDDLASTPRTARRAGRLLATMLVLGFLAFLFLPWQQNISAQGQVVALDPEQREQRIAAPIKGRAVHWHVQEGQLVEEGQLLVEMADVDPAYAERLALKNEAAQQKIDAQERQVTMYEGQVEAFKQALAMTRESVVLRIDAAEQKVIAAQQKLRASKEGRRVAKLQDDRMRQLQAEGLSSNRDLEVAELQRLTAGNQVGIEAAAVSEAQANREAAKADGIRVVAEAEAKIASAEASLSKARSELATARSDILSLASEISRQDARFVRAPRRAWVMRIAGQIDGAVYDVGALLAVLAPDTRDRAVALKIAGNDAPIVRVGSRVQLQFEGWPAVFFSGWPELSSGTFTGVVHAMDALTQTDGSFRALVVADPKLGPWPEALALRQGVRVRAWVLGERVSLGYELWRVFNGFPLDMPTLEVKEGGLDLVQMDEGAPKGKK